LAVEIAAHMHAAEDPNTFSSWWAKKSTTIGFKSNGITTKNISKIINLSVHKMSNFKWLDPGDAIPLDKWGLDRVRTLKLLFIYCASLSL